MNSTACRHCGTDDRGSLYLRRANGFYCEPCVLKSRSTPSAEIQGCSNLVEALAVALDLREHQTGLHSKRVACHTLVLARRFIDEEDRLDQIYWGALLHDIGKIGVPDAVLLKNGPLDPHEWVVMRTHPEKGHQILSQVPYLQEAAEIALAHEERYDGKGYPRGLRGDEIPFGARLFAVIDTLDAMTSDRPYRRALTFDQAREEIRRMAGAQFDPVVVRAFMQEEDTLREMVELKCTVDLTT